MGKTLPKVRLITDYLRTFIITNFGYLRQGFSALLGSYSGLFRYFFRQPMDMAIEEP
jgi:hypothetical protein